MLLSVLFLASCGGGDDDDSPTAPAGDRLDSRLFGTWVEIEEGEGEDRSFITFREDGSGAFAFDSDDLTFSLDVKWWIEGGQLMLANPETFEYTISNGELTFTAVGDGISLLAILVSLGAVFTADGDPGGLTGVRWVYVLEDIEVGVVFSSEGTVNLLFEESDESPWTNGTWTAEGRTMTILWEFSPIDYEVRGKTLTVFYPDGDQVVYSKQ